MFAAFIVQGLLRGTMAQICSYAGLALGALTAVAISRWVGVHWIDARPTVVFSALRVVVALLAGASVASLGQWLGGRFDAGSRSGLARAIDSMGGGLVGAVVGATVAAMLLVWLLPMREPRALVRELGAARSAAMLLAGLHQATRVVEPAVPGLAWIRHRADLAEQRIHRVAP